MIKIYNADTIHAIQKEINKLAFTMTTYHDYDFTNTINSANILLNFYNDPSTGKKASYVIINNPDITSSYFGSWKKETAPGVFTQADFKNDKRDIADNTLYHEIKYTVNNVKYKALVRLLIEFTECQTEEERQDIIKKFGDLNIDNRYFSVIKITLDDNIHSWASIDRFKSDELSISYQDKSDNEYIIEEAEKENADNIEETLTTDPLF